MTYPLFSGSPSEVAEPPVIGGDIEFLLDTPSGFVTKNVGEISEIVESDLYDDSPGTLDNSRIYMLARHIYPRLVTVRYNLIQAADHKAGRNYHQKMVQIIDVEGEVVAEAPYRVYPEAP